MAAILGLDISTGTRENPVGWALFDGAGKYAYSGVRHFVGNVEQRIVAFHDWLDNLLNQAVVELEPVGVIVVEEPTGDHGNRRTDRQLGGVFYVALCLAHRRNAGFYRVSPAAVIATGVSKHSLEAARLWIRDASGCEDRVVGKDEVDAVGVGLAYLVQERILACAKERAA